MSSANTQREVLLQHRHFLAKNIVWTEAIGKKLVKQGVFTESELKEVQNEKDYKDGKGETHAKRLVHKLIEVVPLRKPGLFEKFCNILLLNGHSFIADFLKDEEKSIADPVDLKPLFRQLPILDKTLNPEERVILDSFVAERVKESKLKGTWTKEAIAREKDKAIDAKQRQLEDAFRYEAKDKEFKKEVALLEKKIAEGKNEVIELKSQLGYMGGRLKETENKFKQDFSVQMKYNSANDNQMKRLEDKIEKDNKVLQHLEKGIAECMSIQSRNSERDQMAKAEYRFTYLDGDFDRFVDRFKILEDVEKQYEELIQERNYILAQLGYHSSSEDKPSLLNAYRDFAVKTDEDMTSLKSQIEKYSHTIEGQQERIQNMNKEMETSAEQKKLKTAGTAWQNAMMSVMRKQLNDVKHENRVKDTRMKNYESELNKMKARLSQLGSTVSSSDDTQRRNANDGGDDKRNNVLPPILYSGPDGKQPENVSPTARSHKSKATGSQKTGGKWGSTSGMGDPGGLTTQQLRLDHKAGEEQLRPSRSPNNKVNKPIGGLKVTQGKPSKYAHVR